MKQDEIIARYARELEVACGMHVDRALLQGVTAACGPLIHDPATEAVTLAELGAFRKAVQRKFGSLPALDEALQAAWEAYDTKGPRYRAVLIYLLAQNYGRQDLFRPKAG